jgi:hypothetical protein
MFFQSNRAGGSGGNDIYLSTRPNVDDDFSWTTPVNVGTVINSISDELNATYFEDPNGTRSLIFSSDRDGIPLTNYHLYQSIRNPDGSFGPPTPITELNSEGAEFGVAIRRDGLEILFGSSRPGGVALPKFDIWVATRSSTNSQWNMPVLAANINTPAEERLPKFSPDGSVVYFQSDRNNGSGNISYDVYTAARINRSVPADFDGDGRSDISVFRPSSGTWYIMQSGTNTFKAQQFGASSDKIVPGDYDGDGRIDIAVFRPEDRTWYVNYSSTGETRTTNWGLATDLPVPDDYDGDGRTDIAVFRDGVWYGLLSSNGAVSYQFFGIASDIPISAGYPH